MGDLVNLKQIKKRIAREQADKQAETNRIRFGRTKGQKEAEALAAEKARRALDQARRED